MTIYMCRPALVPATVTEGSTVAADVISRSPTRHLSAINERATTAGRRGPETHRSVRKSARGSAAVSPRAVPVPAPAARHRPAQRAWKRRRSLGRQIMSRINKHRLYAKRAWPSGDALRRAWSWSRIVAHTTAGRPANARTRYGDHISCRCLRASRQIYIHVSLRVTGAY